MNTLSNTRELEIVRKFLDETDKVFRKRKLSPPLCNRIVALCSELKERYSLTHTINVEEVVNRLSGLRVRVLERTLELSLASLKELVEAAAEDKTKIDEAIERAYQFKEALSADWGWRDYWTNKVELEKAFHPIVEALLLADCERTNGIFYGNRHFRAFLPVYRGETTDLALFNCFTVPKSIGFLTSLQSLKISLDFVEFPLEMGRLTQLKRLTLVKGVETKLPLTINRLPHLAILDLTSCQLKEPRESVTLAQCPILFEGLSLQ